MNAHDVVVALSAFIVTHLSHLTWAQVKTIWTVWGEIEGWEGFWNYFRTGKTNVPPKPPVA